MTGAPRRAFLAGAGGAVSAAALAGTAAAASAAGAGREVALLSTYVAGTGYHAGAAAVARLRPDEAVALRREPDSGYDARAVSVWTERGEKLGYVPRIDNQALANLMDAGFRPVARVRSATPGGAHPEIRLDVRLVLNA